MIDYRLFKVLLLLLFTTAFTGCATVSFNEPKSYSEAVTDTNNTQLGQSVFQWTDTHGGTSGFYPLIKGMDSLGARLRLAERAEKSIDLQYFLIKNDTAGAVMANALLKAADRGVRVRLLLDDVFTTAPDRGLLLINQHPNIEIRLFNPISRYGFYSLNFIGDFKQANRRMHNKSFTVDNQISIVGGRNIADEYFQLKPDNSIFIDFDVLALGPIAPDISKTFDKYWNHSRAIPIQQIVTNKKNESLETVRNDIEEKFNGIYDTTYKTALESQLLQELIANDQLFFPAEARVISDSPDKLINEISEEQMQLANDLRKVILSAEKEVVFISPYYIPGDRGVQLIRNLVDKGVRVIILTNSLASNNHIPVHSAYARYRKDIIKAGAELYEARANTSRGLEDLNEKSQTLTLHTKLVLIDQRYMFVGSLNLDPRSIEINSEMGLLIDSKEMLSEVAYDLDERLVNTTYRLILNEKGRLEWHSRINGEAIIETTDPSTSSWLRFKAWFMKIAPEKQL